MSHSRSILSLHALVWTLLGFALIAPRPAAAQQGQTCIGRTCGRDMGFPIEHCHIRPGGNPNGNDICWSSLLDFACENMGYEINIACPAGVGIPPLVGNAGGISSQLPTALGAQNIFNNQLRTSATPRMAQEEADAAEEQESDSGSGGAVHFSQMTTALEQDSWDFAGAEGETLGARFDWRRETETGMLWGAAASYQQAEPDVGDSTDLINGSVSFGHRIGESIWKWSASATVSHFSGLVDDTLYGGSGQLSFDKGFDNGAVLSGGVVGQYLLSDSDGGDDDVQTLGYGLAYGFPLGQRFALDFDAYGVSILEPDIQDDNFYTFGAMLTAYLSQRFGLTLGYRILEGIDELDSDTLTFGVSTRWW